MLLLIQIGGLRVRPAIISLAHVDDQEGSVLN